MKKRIFASVFLVVLISLYLLILTSCGNSEMMGITARVTGFTQLGSSGNGTTLRVDLQINNNNGEMVVDGCEVTLRFYDNTDTLLSTERRHMDVSIDPDGIYGGSIQMTDTGNVYSNTARIEVTPYSMTCYEKSEGCSGVPWWGAILLVLGISFVGGVIWGVFFD